MYNEISLQLFVGVLASESTQRKWNKFFKKRLFLNCSKTLRGVEERKDVAQAAKDKKKKHHNTSSAQHTNKPTKSLRSLCSDRQHKKPLIASQQPSGPR